MEASLPHSHTLSRWRTVRSGGPELAILVLAVLLRLLLLDLKPAHFDEGVNGYWVDQMTKQGFYHYDPTNFHGPLHFYVLHFCQTLLGRHAWVLRLPVALFSVLCVGMALAYRRFFGRGACLFAALAFAVSPGMTFYGRYAIHETFLLFSLMVATWGMFGLWRSGRKLDLWAAALGVTGMILTKETYAIHLAAGLLAVPTLLGLERLSPSALEVRAKQQWSWRDLQAVIGVSLGAIVFFYSGGLMDWSSLLPVAAPGEIQLPSLLTTFATWTETGKAGNGHEKPWFYWVQLAWYYEWATLFGGLLALTCLWPRIGRFLRYLAIAGGGTAVAYSLVPYKTPWCIISVAWPFLFVFGAALQRAVESRNSVVAGAMGIMLLGHDLSIATWLNFFHDTDPDQPYVYVQTQRDIEKIMGPLRQMVHADPANYHLRGHILLTPAGEGHPLPWLLGDFTNVSYLSEKIAPGVVDADFLVIHDPFVSDVEDRLTGRYFRDSAYLRGSSELNVNIYWKADVFARVFPGRTPEFEPHSAAPAPATVEP